MWIRRGPGPGANRLASERQPSPTAGFPGDLPGDCSSTSMGGTTPALVHGLFAANLLYSIGQYGLAGGRGVNINRFASIKIDYTADDFFYSE